MFDIGLRSADDSAVVAAIEECAVEEARASARRLAAIAELVRRRCTDDERAHWACDEWDAAAAEVSAALGVSHGRASGQMLLAVSLRHRLPQVASLFMDGKLSYRVCSAIAARTDLIQDRHTLETIDAAIAEHAHSWGPLSDLKLQRAIDAWVDRIDPGALRQNQVRARDREIGLGTRDTRGGVSEIWGRLYATDATVLDRRLSQMAHGVCEDDPRTIAQRRADALGALAAGSDRLACSCGSPGCPSGDDDGRATSVVIHVVADAESLAAEPDPATSGERTGRNTEPGGSRQAGGVLTGHGGIVPAPLLAELVRAGAKVRYVRRPGDEPESGYRPSTALDEFVRLRDLTCRFPNCDVPAELCDVDHTIPWPWGKTHASNLSCKCRKHHLLKTFWEGWTDRQLPDGTLIWTSPTGRTYVTRPGSRLLIPQWDTTTAALPPPSGEPPPSAVGLMMPTRRRTRAAQRAYRSNRERKLNDARVADRSRPPPF
ncbi:HNH endonuclease [Mycolicibacterium sp. CH28]|uniref:HNH endonuclease signature motif containing protein n=1 Tax=Mycolicibacterium sp. CH28 TaxID=2512237 RepID=UPI001081EB9D|nr:HNH endonuclease signature motif containing protein [Mycolicibacterium sp. CH28]TGD89289.1 HNH endonuclease [Mycolicibacterium sp. CH28]